MTPEILVSQLTMSKEYLDRATRELAEEDSGFAPDDDSYTVAAQMGHIGLTIDWFVEGAFGKGWDLSFEVHDSDARAFTSLKAAREKCAASYQSVIDLIASKSMDELLEMWPEDPVMGSQPKLSIVAGIVEHTAHHRGSLSVYTRLRGKVPPMPYMDMDAAPNA